MGTSISIISTSLQLINCVEFLKEKDLKSNTLIVYSLFPQRTNQIMTLLQSNAYCDIFNRVIVIQEHRNRYLNVVVSFISLIKLFGISFRNIDYCIAGNYLIAAHRFLISRYQKRQCDIILIDDGLTTTEIAKWRPVELENGNPHLFKNSVRSMIYFWPVRKKCIPIKVTYYTVYDVNSINPNHHDTVLHCNYDYLLLNLEAFSISQEVLSGRVFFIGQPFYDQNVVTPDRYSFYLNKLADSIDADSIVYVPHPVENNLEKEIIPLVDERYKLVKTNLPFEILACVIKPQSTLYTFFSSVIVNLNEMRKDLHLKALYLSELDNADVNNSNLWAGIADSYKYFIDRGIDIVRID